MFYVGHREQHVYVRVCAHVQVCRQKATDTYKACLADLVEDPFFEIPVLYTKKRDVFV